MVLAIVRSVDHLLTVSEGVFMANLRPFKVLIMVFEQIEIVFDRVLLGRDVVEVVIMKFGLHQFLMSVRLHCLHGAVELVLVVEFFNMMIRRPEEILVVVFSHVVLVLLIVVPGMEVSMVQ